ncbi:hypothetical protein FKW77_001544 [Venturia effusa]|uniref:Ubiquitin 3 binding protein But2 C-terminal domain-containing protein n=1 Tax=Venturia effusa TaxID=50376 RepID=A0A517L2Q5_9PEZI|nr:hypothetical protein FKW77_001544 [Venturia effusa]
MTRLISNLALPLLFLLALVQAGWIQEAWSITQLTTHFMGKNSGLGDGTWPPASGFSSTASFILRQSFRRGPSVGGMFRESAKPMHNDVHCSATWTPNRVGRSVVDAGKMPEGWIMCEEGRNASLSMRFRFRNLTEGVSANPTGFGMEVGVVGTEESWVVPFATDANIPDVNNVTDPYGWLICAGAEPLSGVHCQLEGQVTKYGYNMLKPSTIMSNQTSDTQSFDRRSGSRVPEQSIKQATVKQLSPIQFRITNMHDSVSCQNEINFDIVHSSLSHCSLKWPCSKTPATKSKDNVELHGNCTQPRYSFTIDTVGKASVDNGIPKLQWPLKTFHLTVHNATCADRFEYHVLSGLDVAVVEDQSACRDGGCSWFVGDGSNWPEYEGFVWKGYKCTSY